jgi:rubrerythrin
MDLSRDTLSESPSKTLRCTNCGHVLEAEEVVSPPPCPQCGAPYNWEFVVEDEDADRGKD